MHKAAGTLENSSGAVLFCGLLQHCLNMYSWHLANTQWEGALPHCLPKGEECPHHEEQTSLWAWGHRGFHGEKECWLHVIMVGAMVVWWNTVIGGVGIVVKAPNMKTLPDISFSPSKTWLYNLPPPESLLANLYVFWTRKHQHEII